MNEINITTVADLRRALATPGVVVYVDRNDLVAERLRRDPARMAQMGEPRTVKAVRSGDVVFTTTKGETHLDLPKRDNLDADGGNVVRVAFPQADGTRPMIEYRIEAAGSPGAATPSRLAERHPPIDDAQRTAEADAQTNHKARQDAALEQHRLTYEKMKAMPLPPLTTKHDRFVGLTKAAIADALRAGKRYQDDLTAAVLQAMQQHEHAEAAQLPTRTVVRDTTPVAPYVLQGIAAREIAQRPRGTWMVFEEDMGHGTSRTALISTGGPEPAYAHHPYQGGGYAEVKARLDAHETYALRKVVEAEETERSNAAAMARRAFRVGQAFDDVILGGNTYRKATITAMDGLGKLELLAQRPRSPKRYALSCAPSTLDAALAAKGSTGTSGPEGLL